MKIAGCNLNENCQLQKNLNEKIGIIQSNYLKENTEKHAEITN